jgi:hypothetical protein
MKRVNSSPNAVITWLTALVSGTIPMTFSRVIAVRSEFIEQEKNEL